MIKYLWVLGLAVAWLQGMEIVVVPDYAPYAETIFPKGEVINFHEASFWGKMKYLLNREGHGVSSTSADSLPHKRGEIRQWIDGKGGQVKLLIWNGALPEEKLKKFSRDNLAVIMFEPPSVIPWAHVESYNDYFSKVITWQDDLIDGDKFIKFCYPVCLPMTTKLITFSERKLCCLMAANKKSKFIHELYSERVRAIKYFNQFPDQFDLYGPDWKKKGFKSYKGWVEDKLKTLRNYKFAICYENTKEVQGYITEKIFDCFQAGVVPIYWGAPNIVDDVPANCFIDRRNFTSYEELHRYILSISEGEFNQYLDNMRTYLASDQAKKYTVNESVLAVVNGLIGTHLTADDLPK